MFFLRRKLQNQIQDKNANLDNAESYLIFFGDGLSTESDPDYNYNNVKIVLFFPERQSKNIVSLSKTEVYVRRFQIEGVHDRGT